MLLRRQEPRPGLKVRQSDVDEIASRKEASFQRTWRSRDYQRQCTDEEAALLETKKQREERESLAEAAAEREQWFASLKDGMTEGGDPPPVD